MADAKSNTNFYRDIGDANSHCGTFIAPLLEAVVGIFIVIFIVVLVGAIAALLRGSSAPQYGAACPEAEDEALEVLAARQRARGIDSPTAPRLPTEDEAEAMRATMYNDRRRRAEEKQQLAWVESDHQRLRRMERELQELKSRR